MTTAKQYQKGVVHLLQALCVCVVIITLNCCNEREEKHNDAKNENTVRKKYTALRGETAAKERSAKKAYNKVKNEGGKLGFSRLAEELRYLAVSNPALVCDLLSDGVGSPHNISEIKLMVFSEMLNNTPPGKLEPMLLKMIGGFSGKSEDIETASALLKALGRYIASKGGDGYMQCVKVLLDGSAKRNGSMTFFSQLAQNLSIKEALAVLERSGVDGKSKKEALRAIAYQSRKRDPEASLALLDNFSVEFLGGEYGDILSALIKKNPERGIEAVRRIPQDRLAPLFLSGDFIMLLSDPKRRELAQDITSKIPFNQRSAPGFTTLLSKMIKSDFEGAGEIVGRLPDGPMKTQIVKTVWGKLGINNPQDAIERFAKVPEAIKNDVASSFLSQLAAIDLKRAEEFVTQLPTDTRRSLMADLIKEHAFKSHVSAASKLKRELENGMIDSDGAREAGAAVALVWVNQDRAAAVTWAQGLPESAKVGAYHSIVKSWSAVDPKGASEWLFSMNPSPSRDSGIRALIKVYEKSDPQAVTYWQRILSQSDN